MQLLRKVTAYLLLFLVWGNLELSMAQTSGLPAPSVSALTTASSETLFAGLTGCATANYVFTPQAGDCVAQTGAISSISGDGNFITNSSSTGAVTLTLHTAAQNSVWAGPATGGAGAASYQTAPTISAANMTNFPTLNQSTTGSAAEVASSETVTFSATPTFSTATRYSTITMTAAITSFTLAAGVAGQEKTLSFCENSTGGFAVTAPSNVHGFMNITSTATASKCNSQHFNYDTNNSAWLADGPGIINE
jgi:hypothetical protein